MLTFGILVPVSMAMAIPETYSSEDTDSFMIESYWRVIWGVALVISAFQTLLLLTCFRFETPVMMKARSDEIRLEILMHRCYKHEYVKTRIEQIVVPQVEMSGASTDEVTYWQTLFDPTIRQSAWVGSTLFMFQQLSGINAIILYSGTIFKVGNFGVSPAVGSTIVMLVNMLATLLGMFLARVAGRRTIMLVSQFIMVVSLIFVWIC